MTTTPETPELLRNEWGREFTIQTLAHWQGIVAQLSDVKALNAAKQQLSRGNEGMGHVHPFTYNSADWDAAWKALFSRAKELGCWYDKVSKLFRQKL